MEFPKNECFSIVVKSLDQAVSFATTKRRFGGCFEKTSDGFIVRWLAKDDARVKNFAW